ncbi:TRAP transporter small permease [Aminivibrio sp.]|jgi:TRAP-type C4-dicarboxylate transport system permease small subunit|uniref:TRAP transporter small permease n=1 Tax=Aminivibrio sp. TaxID=1872489 RepID=UPI001A59542C|nr:TRAP transporter small permease [Aminivibrio sp.]MBL3539410.1 TRAP transporter small permease [Aminivibrio sp.]MDK2959125.1 TRAP-type transport system small permease protein [Synergistaceae bacterium]
MEPARHPEQKRSGLARWTRRLERISAWTACFLLLVNVGDILLGIFCRYVLKSSIIWTEEVARFSLVWMVMMGALGAAVKGDHMVIDFVVPRFPAALRRFVEWGRFLLAVGILSLMIRLGWVNAVQIWDMKTMALNIPKTIPLLSIPVGFALLLAGTVLMHLQTVGRR